MLDHFFFPLACNLDRLPSIFSIIFDRFFGSFSFSAFLRAFPSFLKLANVAIMPPFCDYFGSVATIATQTSTIYLSPLSFRSFPNRYGRSAINIRMPAMTPLLIVFVTMINSTMPQSIYSPFIPIDVVRAAQSHTNPHQHQR